MIQFIIMQNLRVSFMWAAEIHKFHLSTAMGAKHCDWNKAKDSIDANNQSGKWMDRYLWICGTANIEHESAISLIYATDYGFMAESKSEYFNTSQ